MRFLRGLLGGLLAGLRHLVALTPGGGVTIVSAAAIGVTVGAARLALNRAESRGYSAGYQDAVSAGWQRRVDTLQTEVARLDTLYVRDTVRLWREVARWDTLTRADTVWLGTVVAADSARSDSALRQADRVITECRATVLSCEVRVARERELRQAAESLALSLRQGGAVPRVTASKSTFRRAADIALIFGLGAATGVVISR